VFFSYVYQPQKSSAELLYEEYAAGGFGVLLLLAGAF
jgi:hypothetical protein